MRARWRARLLPHGPVDLLRQIALFAAAYYVYRLTRGVADNPGVVTAAFNNARALINTERTLNVFIEPRLQTLVSGEHWLADTATWLYINAQTSVTLGALAWIYLWRNASFYFVRNMFLVAFAIALVGYTLFPTAPPRFLPEWGFIDTVAESTGVPPDSVTVDKLFNPYAAVPSMHTAFAVMIGWTVARLVRSRVLKALWAAYPLIVIMVIVATANHFIADAFLGACTAGLAALAARCVARARPAAWSFRTSVVRTATA